METIQIHITNLTVDQYNPRRTLDTKAIETLKKSVEAIGIVTPLVVRRAMPEGVEPIDPTKTKYTVLCGSRRLHIAKALEMTSVPCVVRTLTDAEAAEVALSEQDSHENLHYLERAEAFLRWRDAGVTAQEIAEKLGQHVSGVHAIIALNRLTPEVKRACWDGAIYEETARLIAAMPPQVHAAILKKCQEPSVNGGPKSTRECREVVASFRLDLRSAPFNAEDATLPCLKHEGGCVSCPNRSGTAPELFSEVKNEWLCLFQEGFRSKADAAWARLIEDGKANRGPACLEQAQTDGYFSNGHFRDDVGWVLADSPAYEDTAQRAYRELLGRGYRQHVKLVRNPKTLEVMEVLGREGLNKLLDEHGKIKRPEPVRAAASSGGRDKASAEEKKKAAAKVARRQKAIRAALALISEKLNKRGLDKRLLKFLCESLARQNAMQKTAARRDMKDPAKYIAKLDESQLGWLALEGSAEHCIYGADDGDKWPPRLVELAQLVGGIDLTDAEREVVAAEKAAPVKKAKATKGKKEARAS